MPGWLSDDELKGKLAAVVKSQDTAGVFDPDNLPGWWDQHVADSNADAYYSVLAALASRGFVAADLAGWPLGKSYQTDMALYRGLVKGAVAESGIAVSETLLDRLNRLAELDTLLLTDSAGNVLEPADEEAEGPVGHGDMRRSDDVTRTWAGSRATWKAW